MLLLLCLSLYAFASVFIFVCFCFCTMALFGLAMLQVKQLFVQLLRVEVFDKKTCFYKKLACQS